MTSGPQLFTIDDYQQDRSVVTFDLLIEDARPIFVPDPIGFDVFTIYVFAKIRNRDNVPVTYEEVMVPWKDWCRMLAAESWRRAPEPDSQMNADENDLTLAHQALVMAARQTRPTDAMTHAIIATQIALLRAAGSTFQETIPHGHEHQPGPGSRR